MSRGFSAILLLALVLSACGSSTKTVTVTSAPTGTAASPSSSTSTASPTQTSTGQGATSTSTSTASQTTSSRTASAPTAVVHLTNFKSPTGNIGCYVFGDSARCDIARRSWSTPPRPSSCALDYGQGVIVTGNGSGRLVCAGDTALNPNAPVLAYGAASTVGPYRCTSAPSGMTCTNFRTGHGFSISRQSYRTY